MANILTQRRILFRGFDPSRIPGLALWLDAADASTVTLDGSNNVSEWRDKSGNSRHFDQADTLRKPSYSLAALNNNNAIAFDGTNDALRRNNEAWAYNYPLNIFVVFRTASFPAAYNSLWDFYGDASGTTASHTGLIRLNQKSAIYIATTTGQTNYDGSGAITYATNQTHQFSAVIQTNSITSRGDRLDDGVLSASFIPRATPQGTFANVIGASLAFGRYTPWRIGEFLVFTGRVLTVPERDAVEAYLAAKWGTP
jgi:hypothetical protein